jgi:hypothetical protein
MDPLSRVEEYLGAVESWPTYIIQQMIVEEQSERSVREVAEFMYGKGVPFELAVECFDACNGGCVLFVEEEMHSLYEEANSDPFMLHKTRYYSIQLAWINGWACNQLEPVETNAQVRYFGLEPAGCVKMIQSVIDNVREGRSNERTSSLRPLCENKMYCNNTIVYE